MRVRRTAEEKVTEDAFAEAVFDLPPQRWGETLRRLNAVRRYRAGKPSTERALEGAAELGLGLRAFYNLVRAFDIHGRPAAPIGSWGRPKGKGVQVEAIMDEEIRRDLRATLQDIFDRVAARCASEHLTVPSIGTVAFRRNDAPAHPDVQSRIRRDCDFVLDGAPLDFSIDTGRSIKRAWLFALIEAQGGWIVDYALEAGRPAPNLLLASLPPSPDPVVLLPTVGAPAITNRKALELAAQGVLLDKVGGVDVDRGAAIRAVLGRHLGRVKIGTLLIDGEAGRSPPIPTVFAKAIVDLLLERSGRIRPTQPL